MYLIKLGQGALFTVLVVCISSESFAKNCGQIKRARGKVEVLRVNPGQGNAKNPVRKAIMAKAPFNLICTDIVVTQKASRAKVKMGKASISLSPNTRISVALIAEKTGDPEVLNMVYGKIRTIFKDKAETDKTKFRVRTPSAVAGVRGTDFYMSFEPNSRVTEQATITGKVEVQQRGTNQKVMVEKGMQVEVEKVAEAKPIEEKIVKNVKEVIKEDIATTLPKKEVGPEAEKMVSPKPVTVLEVKPIAKKTVKEIQVVSSVAKNDKEFTSKEAVILLGEPKKWVAPEEVMPDQFKGLKNEF